MGSFPAYVATACANGLTWSTALEDITASCVKNGIHLYKEYKKLDQSLKCANREFEMMECYQIVLETR